MARDVIDTTGECVSEESGGELPKKKPAPKPERPRTKEDHPVRKARKAWRFFSDLLDLTSEPRDR